MLQDAIDKGALYKIYTKSEYEHERVLILTGASFADTPTASPTTSPSDPTTVVPPTEDPPKEGFPFLPILIAGLAAATAIGISIAAVKSAIAAATEAAAIEAESAAGGQHSLSRADPTPDQATPGPTPGTAPDSTPGPTQEPTPDSKIKRFSDDCNLLVALGNAILAFLGSAYSLYLVLFRGNYPVYIGNASDKYIRVILYEEPEEVNSEFTFNLGNGGSEDATETKEEDSEDSNSKSASGSKAKSSRDIPGLNMINQAWTGLTTRLDTFMEGFTSHLCVKQNKVVVHGSEPQPMSIPAGERGEFLVRNDAYITVLSYTPKYDPRVYDGPSLAKPLTEGFAVHVLDRKLTKAYTFKQSTLHISEDFHEGRAWHNYVPPARRSASLTPAGNAAVAGDAVVSNDAAPALPPPIPERPSRISSDVSSGYFSAATAPAPVVSERPFRISSDGTIDSNDGYFFRFRY